MTVRHWAVCLAILVAWPSFPDRASAQDAAWPPDQRLTQVLNPLGGIPLATVSPFLDRPLFAASRRKAAVRPAAVAVPAAPTPVEATPATHYRLLGTIATATGVSAVIQDAAGDRTRTVRSGEAIDRWRIAQIEASRVRLEGNGRSVWLEMFGPTAAAAGPAGASLPSVSNSVPAPPPPAMSTGQAPPAMTGGAAPPGTVAGTAAAEAARRSTHSLTFGTAEPRTVD